MHTLLDAAVGTGPGAWQKVGAPIPQRFQIKLATAGTATVLIEVTLDQVTYCTYATVSFTAPDTVDIPCYVAWDWFRANVSAIAGGGNVTVLMGE